MTPNPDRPLNDAWFVADFFEGVDSLLELLTGVGCRDLDPDA